MKSKLFISIYFIAFSSVQLYSQDLPPNGTGGSDPDVPVDGGIVTIVGGALLYGIKQLRKKQTESD